MSIPKKAEAALAGAAPGNSIAGINRPLQDTPAPAPAQQSPLPSRAFVTSMAEQARDAAADAMLRATTQDEIQRAAWRYAVCAALVNRLNGCCNHVAYVAPVIDTYSRQSAGRVRLARTYVAQLAKVADETAQLAIAAGVFA